MSKFTGDGFSRQPLEEDELAKHREMYREFEGQRPFLSPLVNILKSAKSLAVTFAVIGVLAGGITYAVQIGFFQ